MAVDRARRGLLGAGVALGVGWAAAPAGAAARAAVDTRQRPAPDWPGAAGPRLWRSDFVPQLDSPFVVTAAWRHRTASTRLALRLVDVSDTLSAKDNGIAGSETCFALRFSGPARLALRQGTYPVSHTALGELLMFLVPVGRPGRQQLYEATFLNPDNLAFS